MFLPGEDEIIVHRELWKNLQQLKRPADAQAVEITWARARRDLAIDANLTSARLQLSEHAIEQRRFARSVRSNDAEDLAGTNFERHVIDRDDPAKRLAQIGHPEHGGHEPAPSARTAVVAPARRPFKDLIARPASPSSPEGQKAIMTMIAAA